MLAEQPSFLTAPGSAAGDPSMRRAPSSGCRRAARRAGGAGRVDGSAPTALAHDPRERGVSGRFSPAPGSRRGGGGQYVESSFDTLDRGHLRTFVRQRVRDGVLLRLIGKWLRAGGLEAGRLVHPETGTPQGGVLSPWLANVYLHEVLDRWFEEQVKPRLHGRAFLIRYADDYVLGFEHEQDARRVWEVLPKRFAKYGLRLHPEKTRLVDFRRPGSSNRRQSEPRESRPTSFELLGFTHFWGRSRRGKREVRRKTASKRFTRAIQRVREYCRIYRHLPLAEQHEGLVRKLLGHYAYFGVSGNVERLATFRHETFRAWQKWLDRRSHHGRMTWPRFNRMLRRYPLPLPRLTSTRVRLAAHP